MSALRRLRSLPLAALLAALLAATPLALGACIGDGVGSSSGDITDVQHTDVERQSIGNCWLYAQASWVESMHLSATGEKFDVSQSYWTYWHWFDQILDGWSDEVSTGGNQWTSNALARDRGIMWEADFVPEDATGEMSYRQETALHKINQELKSGRLADHAARQDGELVRKVLDEAWGLSDEVRGELDQAFRSDGSGSLRGDPSQAEGTKIVSAQQFAVRYTARHGDSSETEDTNLVQATSDWQTVSYPSYGSGASLQEDRRAFQIRVQRALHDRQPVVVTWDVDFNAMENGAGELQGSFNLETLKQAGGPGRQGGHMTVLEDYEAVTEDYGLLRAGVTLDPNNADDAAKLQALLLPSTSIRFFRIKNSWGSLRPDREFAPGFPGYHDLYMDYLDGPISWCPSEEGSHSAESCTGTTVPLNSVMLPPGY